MTVPGQLIEQFRSGFGAREILAVSDVARANKNSARVASRSGERGARGPQSNYEQTSRECEKNENLQTLFHGSPKRLNRPHRQFSLNQYTKCNLKRSLKFHSDATNCFSGRQCGES